MNRERIAIFDIDGTLARTSQIDDECYQEAIRLEWNVTGVSTDWSAYDHSTDNAIASQVSRVHRGRDATVAELAALRDRFVGLVRERDASLFTEVPGAAHLVSTLPDVDWSIAIATGGWSPSARCKLDRAGIPHAHVPAAFACDARPREAIIRIAAHRAAERAGVASFARVVYVGDGVWDARACKRLGIGFVGVAEGERAERLRAEGAAEILPDFTNLKRVRSALESARVPR